MNYLEALKKVEANKKLIGKPLGEHEVRYLLISTVELLADVYMTYLENGYNNKSALFQHGILGSEDLHVYALPPKYVSYGFTSQLPD